MVRYGRRVLGDEEFERQQAQKVKDKARAFVYGPRVAGPKSKAAIEAAKAAGEYPTTATAERRRRAGPPPGKPAAAPAKPGQSTVSAPAAPEEKRSLSIAELTKALQENPSPALIDKLVAAELERPEGEPRKGALSALIAAEKALGETARPELIKELTGHLNAK